MGVAVKEGASMRRMMMLVAVAALMAAMMVASALPAFADHRAPTDACENIAENAGGGHRVPPFIIFINAGCVHGVEGEL